MIAADAFATLFGNDDEEALAGEAPDAGPPW